MTDVLDRPGVGLDPAALLALRPPPDRLSVRGDGALPGAFRSHSRGQGQDIADLRAYVFGDDMRHLDAGATARTGDLHIRSFHQDQDRALMLVADFRAPMLWGIRRALRSVAAAEALVIAGWQALERGEKPGLAVISDDAVEGLAPAARADTMSQIVGMLCRSHAQALRHRPSPQPLATALAQVARTLPRHARVLIATGKDLPGDAAALRDFAAAQDARVLHVLTGLEEGLPPGHYPVLGQQGDWSGAAFSAAAESAGMMPEIALDPSQPPRPIEEAQWQMAPPR